MPKEYRQTRQNKLHVLVVDDAPTMNQMICQLVESLGHRCSSAEDGYHGFLAASQCVPDLIVTDIEMPIWDGNKLIQAIRKSDDYRLRCLPIIVCSSCGDSDRVDRAIDEGADAFLSKPISLHELQMVIGNILTVVDSCRL